MKYAPPSYSALPQWQVILRLSRCVILLPARSEKHLPGCREPCLYLMWNDTYMTAKKKKSEHNCSVSNKLKCSRRLHQLTHLLLFLFFPLFNSCLSLPSKCVMWQRRKTLISTADRRCQARYLTHWMWSSSLFFFFPGLNAFACSPRMAGQCVSGPTKM